jgi:outer membrane lipoprotein carrier protein
MKRIVSISIVLVISFFSLFGQKNQFTKVGDSDPQAKKILDKLKKEYTSYKSMEVTFELDIEVPKRAKEKQKGNFIQQGKKFFASTKDQDVYCDGKTVWLHLKNNKEVQINNYEDGAINEMMMSPTDMIKMYESGKYIYAITGNEVENGTDVTLIEFKPISKNNEYSKMRMAINTKLNKAVSMKVFGKDGSKFTIQIKNIVPNRNFPPSTFVFDAKKYPNIRQEDLRVD